MNLKLAMKRAAVWTLDRVGPAVPCHQQRFWMCWRVAPSLLDERIVPRGLSARSIRGIAGQVLCDPYIFTHRMPYWFGRLYEEELERYLRANIRPGDTVIDVGMNVGQITVLSACLVGAAGHVYSFEANATLAAQVAEHCRKQRLDQVKVHSVGLGAKRSQAVLHVETSTSGTASLLAHEGDRWRDTKQIPVDIRVGDEELANVQWTGRTFLKLDVEGAEIGVLRGMTRTLRERVGHAVVEVTPEWLGGAAGVAELFSLMETAGLTGHQLTDAGKPGGILRAADVTTQSNVLFLRQ